MQVYFFWAGAVAGFITFYVHTFIGGIYAARPLLANDTLTKASKWLNYYCWHITTILLLFITGAFVYTALNPQRLELVVFVSLLSICLSALSVAVTLKGGINPFRFPSTSLFAIIALLGFAGIALA